MVEMNINHTTWLHITLNFEFCEANVVLISKFIKSITAGGHFSHFHILSSLATGMGPLILLFFGTSDWC
jgi:hypothetical protein